MPAETPYRIEPCLLPSLSPEIADLVTQLASAAQRLEGNLHPKTAAALADMVRIMNCYYSNLIEGHNTTLREIEQALDNRLAESEERRYLQLEARAHIRIQKSIDEGFEAGAPPEPASVDFIRHLHHEFYFDMPPQALELVGANRRFTMVPGKFRSTPEEEVSVGRHLPPSSRYVENFMAYFAEKYRFAGMGQSSRIVAMAAAHHRLNYIHPFPDGNGRVSRLMSHAMGLQAGIGAHGLWSVSRGLARGLESRGDYKRMMNHADMPRQGSLDGRGNLSQRALEDFVKWFLKVCLDQVEFMTDLFRLDTLSARLKRYQEAREWKPEAWHLLEMALIKGEIPRGDAARITGMSERSARNLLAALTEDGILKSGTPKGPVYLHFPVSSHEILFPRLFAQM